MKDLYPAIEARFKADSQLRKAARRLYHGFSQVAEDAKLVRTWVDVECTGGHDDFDTFDTDEPYYLLTFTIHTKSSRPDSAASVVKELTRVFKDQTFDSAEFSSIFMRRTTWRGPYITDDGVYEAEVDFEAYTSRNVMLPAVRSA